MAYLPRGIAPELLVSQVKNTMPYLFQLKEGDALLDRFPPSRVLRNFEAEQLSRPAGTPMAEPLSHFEYFKLCLSSIT